MAKVIKYKGVKYVRLDAFEVARGWLKAASNVHKAAQRLDR